MMKLEIDRSEKNGFQFTLDGGMLVTLRTDSPQGIQGSVAKAVRGGKIEIVEFHQREGGWTIHEPTTLEM